MTMLPNQAKRYSKHQTNVEAIFFFIIIVFSSFFCRQADVYHMVIWLVGWLVGRSNRKQTKQARIVCVQLWPAFAVFCLGQRKETRAIFVCVSNVWNLVFQKKNFYFNNSSSQNWNWINFHLGNQLVTNERKRKETCLGDTCHPPSIHSKR